jgi:hypothetical protein
VAICRYHGLALFGLSCVGAPEVARIRAFAADTEETAMRPIRVWWELGRINVAPANGDLRALICTVALFGFASSAVAASAVAWNGDTNMWGYAWDKPTVQDAEREALNASGGGSIVRSGVEKGFWALASSYPGKTVMCKDPSTNLGFSGRCPTAIGVAWGQRTQGEAIGAAVAACVNLGGDEGACSGPAVWYEKVGGNAPSGNAPSAKVGAIPPRPVCLSPAEWCRRQGIAPQMFEECVKYQAATDHGALQACLAADARWLAQYGSGAPARNAPPPKAPAASAQPPRLEMCGDGKPQPVNAPCKVKTPDQRFLEQTAVAGRNLSLGETALLATHRPCASSGRRDCLKLVAAWKHRGHKELRQLVDSLSGQARSDAEHVMLYVEEQDLSEVLVKLASEVKGKLDGVERPVPMIRGKFDAIRAAMGGDDAFPVGGKDLELVMEHGKLKISAAYSREIRQPDGHDAPVNVNASSGWQ